MDGEIIGLWQGGKRFPIDDQAAVLNYLFRVFLAISLLLMAGCFQVDTVVMVNPDGSGTVVESMMLSKKMLARMNEMMQGFAAEDGSGPEPFDIYDPKKLKAEADEMGEGVSFQSAKRSETADYSGYTVTYAFKDINKLRLNQRKGAHADAAEGGKSPSAPLLFHFRKGSPARLTVEMPRGKSDGAASESMNGKDESAKESAASSPSNSGDIPEEEAKMLMETFMGMRMMLSLEVKGDIMETNATHLKGNRITIVDFDLSKFGSSIPQMEKLNKLKGSSLAEAKELLRNFPGMKMDMNDQLTVEFTK